MHIESIFKLQILRVILKFLNRLRGVPCPGSGLELFVPPSWTCKKQSSVPHSTAESEMISFDTGTRMDGFPSLDLCDSVNDVFFNILQHSTRRLVAID